MKNVFQVFVDQNWKNLTREPGYNESHVPAKLPLQITRKIYDIVKTLYFDHCSETHYPDSTLGDQTINPCYPLALEFHLFIGSWKCLQKLFQWNRNHPWPNFRVFLVFPLLKTVTPKFSVIISIRNNISILLDILVSTEYRAMLYSRLEFQRQKREARENKSSSTTHQQQPLGDPQVNT